MLVYACLPAEVAFTFGAGVQVLVMLKLGELQQCVIVRDHVELVDILGIHCAEQHDSLSCQLFLHDCPQIRFLSAPVPWYTGDRPDCFPYPGFARDNCVDPADFPNQLISSMVSLWSYFPGPKKIGEDCKFSNTTEFRKLEITSMASMILVAIFLKEFSVNLMLLPE